jgi:hypothetical protein
MTIDEIRAAIETALEPEQFFAAGNLIFRHRTPERLRWEIFRGHLLDERHTRSEALFETWDVSFHSEAGAAPRPLISIKLAAGQSRLHVTRELLVYGEEVYEPSPNVVATRPAQVPLRELVGTIELARFASAAPDGEASLAAEIAHYVLLALVGTSRLPVTSVESPLPVFSLGQVGYAFDAQAACGRTDQFECDPAIDLPRIPAGDPAAWLSRALLAPAAIETQARWLEFALRAALPAEIGSIARVWHAVPNGLAADSPRTCRVLRALFNQVALTPYTSLVDNLVALLETLASIGALSEEQWIDTLGYMLRHLVRHLTAFDLVTFHNQGANYPDALLLAALLSAYVGLVARRPDLFAASASDSVERAAVGRVRRRALRQAWIVRRQYVGHAVPDSPTSPGENLRVVAGAAGPVPDEQLLRPDKRRKRLFDGQDELLPSGAARQVFAAGLDDLEHPPEVSELGLALFLDRPLGLFKQPGELDRTPLISYEAFSRQVAAARLQQLAQWGWLPVNRVEQLAGRLDRAAPGGFAVAELPERPPVAIVALDDALRTAADFQLLRTTRQSLDRLLSGYDLAPLIASNAGAGEWLTTSPGVLLVRTADVLTAEQGGEFLTAFDGNLRPRLRLALARPGRPAYCEARGVELLRDGLLATQLDDGPSQLLLAPKC